MIFKHCIKKHCIQSVAHTQTHTYVYITKYKRIKQRNNNRNNGHVNQRAGVCMVQDTLYRVYEFK